MANLFLDANYFIGSVLGRNDISRKNLEGHKTFISVLSVHILYYVEKIKVPEKITAKMIAEFEPVDFNKQILIKSLQGPTKDLEDNIQLHSAVEAECNYFLTNDKGLLTMKYFGKTKIVSNLRN